MWGQLRWGLSALHPPSPLKPLTKKAAWSPCHSQDSWSRQDLLAWPPGITR